jgi:Ni/Co efflux regulator RcnB
MKRSLANSLWLAALLCLASGPLAADPEHGHDGPPPHGEPHPGPHGYQRVAEPPGWNARPAQFDRAAYEHNFQAARIYHVGPYYRPAGWLAHRWVYGEVLPRPYWAPNYIVADYWLFALEVPPVGYEWVREDGDALLISVANGQILQVEYSVFG